MHGQQLSETHMEQDMEGNGKLTHVGFMGFLSWVAPKLIMMQENQMEILGI